MRDRGPRPPSLGLWAVAVPFLVAVGLAATGDDAPEGRDAWRFADPEIVESSGLVVTADRVVTVNDSGDEARVFVVDAATGETVGVTRWDGAAEDVEALAPAGDGAVWVADVGDNTRRRDSVTLTRVSIADGERTVVGEARELTYPDGARDAEALLVHPRSGRTFVVTKGVLSGAVYAVPRSGGSDGTGRMREVAAAPGMVTDAAFFPDGRHVLLRTYSRAVVLSWPSFEEVGSWRLPDQPQGEGIAVAPDGSVWVSSEGREQPLLRVDVPPRVTRAMAPDGVTADAARDTTGGSASDLAREAADRDARPWVLGAGAAVLLLALAVVGAVRRRRAG